MGRGIGTGTRLRQRRVATLASLKPEWQTLPDFQSFVAGARVRVVIPGTPSAHATARAAVALLSSAASEVLLTSWRINHWPIVVPDLDILHHEYPDQLIILPVDRSDLGGGAATTFSDVLDSLSPALLGVRFPADGQRELAATTFDSRPPVGSAAYWDLMGAPSRHVAP